jgi:hypothetical protein
MIFVTVIEPRGREIYVNGVYSQPVGTTPTLVVLEAGSHIIQTLTGRLVDFEGEVFNVPDFGSEQIDLAPVVPPRPRDE